MSKPTNPSLIGAFILGALALLIGGIIAFSSFSFSNTTYPFVIYITDSVNGLNTNSDVKYKGVKIGKVRDIKLSFDRNDNSERHIPVIVEIEQKSISKKLNFNKSEISSYLETAVKNGLRARVQPTSLLTGMLYIELDFFPETEIVYRNDNEIDLMEIPSIPSNVTQLVSSVSKILNNLASVDFKEISQEIKKTAEKLNQGLDAIEFKKINDKLITLSDSANQILNDPELHTAIKNIATLADSLNQLSQQTNKELLPLSQEFRQTATALRLTLEHIDKLTETIHNTARSKTGTIGGELSDTLDEIKDTTRSLKALSDLLYQNLPVPENETR